MIKSFRELEVWKKSMDFAEHVYIAVRSGLYEESESIGKMLNTMITRLRSPHKG